MAVGEARAHVDSSGQSASDAAPFPFIEEYAFLSDCHTGALVGPDGSIDWLCLPAFDSPSVFASLLDRQAGTFRLGPYGVNVPAARIYEPGTNCLVTSWQTPSGWLLVRDALAIGESSTRDTITQHTRPPVDQDARHMLIRLVECIDGEVEVELVCEPAFDYGTSLAEWRQSDDDPCVADAHGGAQSFRLRSDIAFGVEGDRVRGRHVLREGERAFCVMSWAEGLAVPADVDAAQELLRETGKFWRSWIARARIPDHRWRQAIQRSALAVKGLTYMPTGATIAALTTSLPETPGGSRNWDYRFSWVRDSTFTLQALHFLQLDWEADEFMQFIADLEPNGDGSLQIMYGIDGRRDLSEQRLEHLSGYAGATPVRVGNAAFDQRQNDVYGAVLDSILLHTQRSARLPRRLWPLVRSQAECAIQVWKEPDQGVWEARGEPHHYVSSKLMCWVALDRAARLAEIRGDRSLAVSWTKVADEIKDDILSRGLSERGVLRQHYGSDALDASTLLAVIFNFLPASDTRVRSTVLAIADELTERGHVLRYRTDETDDGLVGREGTFLICSFWLVTALAAIGEMRRARDLMDSLIDVASPLGLYAEELDAESGHHLGNFPQAFSHLALLQAAARIIISERIDESLGTLRGEAQTNSRT